MKNIISKEEINKFKEDGAIAVVATTDAVGYTENSNYLNNIFGLTDSQGIQQFINGNSPVRLGELVLNAKNFQLF